MQKVRNSTLSGLDGCDDDWIKSLQNKMAKHSVLIHQNLVICTKLNIHLCTICPLIWQFVPHWRYIVHVLTLTSNTHDQSVPCFQSTYQSPKPFCLLDSDVMHEDELKTDGFNGFNHTFIGLNT